MPFVSGNSYASLSLLEHCAQLVVYITQLQRLHPSAKLQPEATYSEQNLSITPREGRYRLTGHCQPVTPATAASRGGDEAPLWSASSRPHPARDTPGLTSRGHRGIPTSARANPPRAATCGPGAPFSREIAGGGAASRPARPGGGERGLPRRPRCPPDTPVTWAARRRGPREEPPAAQVGKQTHKGASPRPGEGFYFLGFLLQRGKRGSRSILSGRAPRCPPCPPDPRVNKSGSS